MGPPAADLVGTWNATVVELVSVANSNTRVELISLGYAATLVLDEDGGFFFNVVDPETGDIGGSGAEFDFGEDGTEEDGRRTGFPAFRAAAMMAPRRPGSSVGRATDF